MQYNLTLQCGCIVCVRNESDSKVAPGRLIAYRGQECRTSRHRVGARLYLWDLLPSRIDRSRLLRAELDDDAQWTA